MGRRVAALLLPSEDRVALEGVVKCPTSAQRDVLRARIILLRSEGKKEEEVALALSTSRPTVSLWVKRYRREGLAGLRDAPGRGCKPSLPEDKVARVITGATQSPPAGRSRWSVRSMAKEAGLPKSTVHNLWHKNDIKPHLTRTFKLSSDPRFEEKFWDVIGLYLNPPEKALVLCCDEKSQCQALERTQPGLPLGIGHVKTRTHDYTRHGTVTLFAALSYLEGKVISRTELVQSINAYLEQRNANPKPYRWKAKGADILAKIHRARMALQGTELCKAI